MRALIISPYFPPQNAIASLRTHSFATALRDDGAEVTVLTVAKRPDQRGLDLSCTGMEVVELEYRVPRVFERLRGRYKSGGASGGPSGRTPLAAARRLRERRGIYSSVRMPDLTDYWVKPAVRWCRQRGREQGAWDVLISSSGPYTAHLAAMAVRRDALAACWIADFRDLWLDNHVFRGLFPFTVREHSLERRCLATADLVTTVSGGLRRTLEAKGARRVEVIYNGFDAAALAAIEGARIFPDDGLLRIVYTGALYAPGQDPAPLLEALARVQRDDPEVAARLRLAVSGRESRQWRGMAAARGVEHLVEDRGEVSRDDALRMQRDASALLIIDWSCPREGVLTGKIFEYINATAPILAVGGGEDSPIAEMITRSGRGRHLGGDVDAIAGALRALCEDPGVLRESPDVAFVETFSRSNQARRLVACAAELLG